MAWHETASLTRTLLTDPGSHVSAAASGWKHPMSREGFMLADLFDLTHQAHSGKKRPKPYPRPTDHNTGRSAKPKVSQQAIRAALAARGHGMN